MLVAEIAAIVMLAATFVPAIAERDESSGVPFLVAAIGVAALVSVALGAYWADHYETTSAASAPASVAITDFAFAPPALTVTRGTTVTWTNDDPFGHSVLAADESFASGELGTGQSFRMTFDNAGEFGYVCGIHPTMVGTVTVTD